MPEPRSRYRSLYWRFALGFVALLAVMLVVQAFVFLWMTGRMTELFPSRTPAQFAASLALDVSASLAGDPDVDLDEYLNRQHGSSYRAFVVVLRDDRVAVSHRIPPPPTLVGSARGRLFREIGGPGRFAGRDGYGRGDRAFPDGGRGGFPDGGGRGGFPDGGRGGPSGPRAEFVPVMLNGVQTGIVAVPVDPPPISVAMRKLGPAMAVVALALLVAGTAGAALIVMRPPARRLQQLQRAAQALGAGTSGARAPEAGGDEIASLARTFNAMAAQLEDRTAALETADRTRRQLLADVSHELSTPLSAIRGYVETLTLRDLGIDEASKRRYLGIVLDETNRLEHIIGDLLDLARLEGGGVVFRRDRVDLAALFERLEHRHGPSLRDRQIALHTSAAAGADVVAGDANRLEQALQNLVANAVRHTPEHGTIDVRAFAEGDRIVIDVADSGPGIPEEHLPHVFDRFYKVDVSRAGTLVPSGSGLGLSIVQAIVARHGGTIAASNAPTGGAVFRIVLPGPDVAWPA
jgi:signal transduction histidine kinase